MLLFRYWYHGASAFAPARDEIKYRDYQLSNNNRYDNTVVSCIQFKTFYPYSDIESRKLIAPVAYPKISLISPVEIKIESNNGGYIKTDFEEAKLKGPKAVADLIKREMERAIKNNSIDWNYADEDFPLETITQTSTRYPYVLSVIRKGRKWIKTGEYYHA